MNVNKALSLYVVSHKEFNPPVFQGYIPIQVGRYCTKEYLPYLSDDTGENISNKNITFCELTALYWIWKNRESSDFVGLCHYRRYFTKFRYSNSSAWFLKESDVEEIFKKYDVILPRKYRFDSHTVRERYSFGYGRDADYIMLRKVIEDLTPKYLESFDLVSNSNEASYRNMFIMKSVMVDEYCSWLFEILFELERRIDLSSYSAQEVRLLGFLSEILINVWVRQNGLLCYECAVVNTEENLVRKLREKRCYG